MNYWLVKTEPEEYSFDDLESDGKAIWDGVRNYQARNNLKKMKLGDKVLIYHSGKTKEVVGIAKVFKEHYQDPTDKTGRWVVVELVPLNKLQKAITLSEIKRERAFVDILLLKQSRLSVMPLTEYEFKYFLKGQV